MSWEHLAHCEGRNAFCSFLGSLKTYSDALAPKVKALLVSTTACRPLCGEDVQVRTAGPQGASSEEKNIGKKKKEEQEGKNLGLAPNCLPREIFAIPVPPCWNTQKLS